MEEQEKIELPEGLKEKVLEVLKVKSALMQKKLFERYNVDNIAELDELVEYGYRIKRINEEDKISRKNGLMFTLDELIGCEKIKNKIDRLSKLIVKNTGIGLRISMNYVFVGNPGTGKTVMARALAKKYFDSGIIKNNKVVEVDRSSLIAEYIGQTASKVKKAFDDAVGGVLFVDEAYLLLAEKFDKKDYGFEALGMFNKLMEDYRGKMVVVLAGYKQETMDMLKANKGLRSRINAFFEFPDYNESQLEEILRLLASKYKYKIEESALHKMVRIAVYKNSVRENANARELRNILEGVMEFQAVRSEETPWDRTITLNDVIEYQIENKIVLDSDVTEA